MIGKPSLLMMTAAAASLSALAHGVGIASEVNAAPQTRLGSAIAQDIGRRDQEAAKRARTLDLREKAALATEERIKADLAQREQSEAAAAAAPSAKGQSEDDQFEDLARIYQAMKPAKAAVVFEQLDMDVQMKVAQKMRERSTAMILASMTPKGAAALSMALARKSAAVNRVARPPLSGQPVKSGRP